MPLSERPVVTYPDPGWDEAGGPQAPAVSGAEMNILEQGLLAHVWLCWGKRWVTGPSAFYSLVNLAGASPPGRSGACPTSWLSLELAKLTSRKWLLLFVKIPSLGRPSVFLYIF